MPSRSLPAVLPVVQELRPARGRSPALRLVELDGEPAVVKTFADTPAWYRFTVGRFSLAHELAAYRRLEGCPGIPRLLAWSRDALALEYVEGRPLEEIPPGQLPVTALEQLRETLARMHARNMAHADLGHDFNGGLGRETNMLWSATGRLYLVDLGSVVTRPGFLARAMMAHDRLALTKLVLRYFPDLDDRPALEHPVRVPPHYWRLWRLLGKI